MGTSDLLKMYAQSPRAQPEDCGHTFHANHKCPCYSYYDCYNRWTCATDISERPVGKILKYMI